MQPCTGVLGVLDQAPSAWLMHKMVICSPLHGFSCHAAGCLAGANALLAWRGPAIWRCPSSHHALGTWCTIFHCFNSCAFNHSRQAFRKFFSTPAIPALDTRAMASFLQANFASSDEEDDEYDPTTDKTGEPEPDSKAASKRPNRSRCDHWGVTIGEGRGFAVRPAWTVLLYQHDGLPPCRHGCPAQARRSAGGSRTGR